MKLDLKALGLALAAMFVLAAMSAPAVSAQEGVLTSETTEVTLRGEEDPAGTNALTMFGSEIQCPSGLATGHKSTVTPHEPLHIGETAVTLSGHEGEGCTDGGGGSRTIDRNGCDGEAYDFTTTGEAAGTYGFDFDIVCPQEEEITITGGACVVHVPPQEGLTGLHATNEGGKVRLSGEVTGITASLPCLGSHTSSAVQHVDAVAEGIDPATEEPTNISISD